MNTSVTAKGMSVKAQAGGGLMIATYDSNQSGDDRFGAGFKASATALITDVTSLSPVSTVNATSWYKATAASVDSYAKNSDAYAAVTSAEASSYYLVNHFAISTAGGTKDTDNKLVVNGLKVTPGTTKSAALNKAIRVAVVFSDSAESGAETTKTVFFAPGKDSTAADLSTTWTAVKSDNQTDTVNGFANLTSSATVAVWDNIPALTYVDIYVYYEGEDENCKSNNTTNGVDQLTVEVGFAAVEKAKTPSVTLEQSGATLTATPANIPSGKTATYKIEYCSSGDDTSDVNNWSDLIPSQSSSTFTLTSNDNEGDYVRVVMTIETDNYTSSNITLTTIN